MVLPIQSMEWSIGIGIISQEIISRHKFTHLSLLKRFAKQDRKKHVCNEWEQVCPECGMIGKSKEAMKEHISNEHKQQEATSQIVCKFYRRGNCYKGNECRYAHVGHARTQTNEPRLR